MPPEAPPKPEAAGDAAAFDLSLVRGDIGFRIQQRLGLITGAGMSTARRALVFAGIAWLPLAVWAVLTGRLGTAPGAAGDDSLVAHFGVHVRCLIAIPLFVIAEAIAQKALPPLLRYFVVSGLVPPDELPAFRRLIGGIVRLRNNVLPWVLIAGLVVAWASTGVVVGKIADMTWSGADHGRLTFGGWWFVLVIRPLFSTLLLAWLWRACLVFVLFVKLARFPLALVPTHPDRVGGLGFVERLAFIFSPVAFAVSAVAAASFAHEVFYHGVNVVDIKGELIATVVLISAVFLAPFLPLGLALGKMKRQAILDYGNVAGQHGRLVKRRWILGEDIGAPPILEAAELGPVADVQSMYDAARRARGVPVGKLGIAAIAVPAALPVIFVAAMQLPLQSILAKVLKTLI